MSSFMLLSKSAGKKGLSSLTNKLKKYSKIKNKTLRKCIGQKKELLERQIQ